MSIFDADIRCLKITFFRTRNKLKAIERTFLPFNFAS